MIKKVYSLVIIAFLLLNITVTSAQYTTTSLVGGFNHPIQDNSLNFEAELENGDVYIKWSVFNKEEEMKYYKIIRSATVENPVYPDNGYIKAISNLNETKYIDYKPLEGTSYYRVCAITYENNRYCSNVEKIHNDKKVEDDYVDCTSDYTPVCGYKDGKYKTYSNKCNLLNNKAYYKYAGECKDNSISVCTNVYTPVCGYKDGKLKDYFNKCYLIADKAHYKYTGGCTVNSDKGTNTENDIAQSLKIKSVNMINTFMSKLEKTGYTSDKKLELIDDIINKLNNLEKEKPKLSNVINYLIILLKDKKEKYENDFSQIEDIFNLD